MTKQTINVGTSPNDNRGDSLRASFQKINANFTELYTALGLDTAPLNIGAFEFTGSVLSTTDSTAITIDQATTITSNLTVGGDVLPSVANGGDLGSSTRPWKSLYVSSSTIYIGTTSLGVDSQGNLLVGGQAVADVGTAAWNSITDKPTFAAVATSGAYSDLTGRPTSFNSLVTGAYSVNLESGGVLRANVQGIVSDNQLAVEGSTLISIQTLDGPYLQLFNQGATKEINLVAWDGESLNPTWTFDTDRTLTLPNDSSIKSATNIDITIDTPDSSTFNWRFGADGALTLPSGGTILNSSGQPYVNGVSSINTSVTTSIFTDASGDYTYGTLSYDYAVNGVSNSFSIEYSRPLVGGNVDINVGNTIVNGDLTLSGDIKSNGNINIDINLADSTLRRWQFGEDGLLTFPDGTNYSGKDITLPQTLTGTANKVSWNFSDLMIGNSTTFLEWNLLSTDLSEFLIGTSSAATPFYFSFDGSGQTLGIITGGGIFGGGKLTFGSTAGNNAGDVNAIELKATNGDVYLTSTESVKITVDANDSSARVWLFDPTGNLTLPQGGNISEGGGLTGAIRLTPSGGANANQALLIYPTGFAEGDHLHLTAGGGATELYLGDDYHYVKLESDGNVRIQADNGVNGAAWTFGTDGSLALPGDIRSDSNINIDINLADSTLRRWQFGEDGELTLPEDAVVKTTSGNLTIKGQSYVLIDSAGNGQIEIGTSSGVGAVILGSKSRGTNVVVDDLQVANGVYEYFSSLADATGVVTHNCANGHIFYHTSPDANWTVNLTNLLDTWNRATSVTLIIAQGATGYIPSAVQIAGVAQTIKWQGNVTPTPSTNRTDVVTFSIINVSGTYIVLGQLTGF